MMNSKAVIVSLFALMLAAAAVSGEQYRLRAETAVDDYADVPSVRITTNEVDVTN